MLSLLNILSKPATVPLALIAPFINSTCSSSSIPKLFKYSESLYPNNDLDKIRLIGNVGVLNI